MSGGIVTFLFTDLVGSTALLDEVGDDEFDRLRRAHFRMLRDRVAAASGSEVKSLGDGLMAVFEHPSDAVDAALEAQTALREIQIGGHRPRLRAGVHVGRPRRLGGDYFGVDVNVAARVAQAAGAGEVLVSELAHDRLDGVSARRKWLLKTPKGAPKDLKMYEVQA